MQEVKIQNGSDVIYGKLFSPKDEEKHPLVILSHGYNGSHADFIDDCRFFAQNGYAAYSFDFCGASTRSMSTGSSTNMNLLTLKGDLLSVIKYFEDEENIDSTRIYLLGGSQGGLVSALAAEEVPGSVRALALYYPAFCIPDDWRRTYPKDEDVPSTNNFWGLTLGRTYFDVARKLDVNAATGSYAGNVLIIHGNMDDIVPLRYAQEAERRYPNARLTVLPGERHGFTPAGAMQSRKLVLEFFNGSR